MKESNFLLWPCEHPLKTGRANSYLPDLQDRKIDGIFCLLSRLIIRPSSGSKKLSLGAAQTSSGYEEAGVHHMEENPTRLFMPSHWTGETDSSEVELSKRDRSNAPTPYCLFRGGRKLLWNHSTFIAFHNPIRILQDWNRKRKSSWKMLGASSPHIHPKLKLATRSAGFQILCSASMIGTSRTATWERDFEAFDAPGWLNQWRSIGGQSPVSIPFLAHTHKEKKQAGKY